MIRPSDKEDEYFAANIRNMVSAAARQNYTKFTLFLNDRMQYLAEDVLKACGCTRYVWNGGYEQAQRRMLAVYPDYYDAEDVVFPIECLEFTYRSTDQLTHRDFLGALMSLQVKRDVVGDIIVDAGRTVVLVSDVVAGHVTDSVRKIGRVGVTVQKTDVPVNGGAARYEELSGTVTSLRLDCLAALITKSSRAKAAALIQTGRAAVNYAEVLSPSVQVKPDDIITIRGFGKYLLDNDIFQTKKGRYRIIVKKFL